MPRNYKPKNKHLKDPTTPREGRFTVDEKKFIADNYENLTVDEIAKKLQRNPTTVNGYIDENIRNRVQAGETVLMTVAHDLKKMPFFDELRQEYTKRELQTIEFHWNKLISQFRGDVLHTEQMQILQFAETMVSLSRIKKLERTGEEILEKATGRLDELQSQNKEERDERIWKARVSSAETQIADLRNSRKSVTEEKTKLTKQANELLELLNATRGQRVKIASDQQMDITSLLKAIANDDFRKKAVRQNTLMQLAAKKEKERLSREFKYMDGTYDRPILNSETIFYEEELPLEGDYI